MMTRREAEAKVKNNELNQLYIVYMNVGYISVDDPDEYEFNFESEKEALTFAEKLYNEKTTSDEAYLNDLYVWEFDFVNKTKDIIDVLTA